MPVRSVGRLRSGGIASAACLAAVAAIGLAAVGCERATAPPKAPPATVAVIGPPQLDPRCNGLLAGARAESSRFERIRLHLIAPADYSVAARDRAVAHALTLKPAVACLYVDSADGDLEAIRQLQSIGCAVITMGTGSNSPLVYAHVEASLPAAVELLMQEIAALTAPVQSAVLIHERSRSDAAQRSYDRFHYAARRLGSLTLLSEADVAAGPLAPADAVREQLATFPSAGALLLLSLNIWREGLPTQPPTIFALGATPAQWDALRQGKAALLAGHVDPLIGRRAIGFAARAISGDAERGGIGLVEPQIVSARNASAFVDRYLSAAGANEEELRAPLLSGVQTP